MPKRVPPLSAKKLEATRATVKPIELVDGYVPGLRVRISPIGNRTWSLNIRDLRGIRRRFDVGAGLSLSDARRKAEKLRQEIRDGADPTAKRSEARKRARAARNGNGTLDALVRQYFETGPGAENVRAPKNIQLLRTVFEGAIDKPALEVQRGELQLTADKWRSKSSAALAVRLLRPALKWAEKRELVSPGIHDLEAPGRPCKRERVLTGGELRAIWGCLTGTHGEVIRWLLWTGCRLNEAAGMTWQEISGSEWKIPSARTKNARSRTVPLPRQAVTSLGNRSREPALVFPSKRGGVLSNWDRETKKIQQRSGTNEWHRHDLRRTVATMLGDLGFAPHIVSVVLGHTNIAEGVTAVYARSRYQAEHKTALQALADEIDRTCAA